jgi:hypothetical protein
MEGLESQPLLNSIAAKMDHLQAYLNEFDFRYSNRTGMGVDDTLSPDLPLGPGFLDSRPPVATANLPGPAVWGRD